MVSEASNHQSASVKPPSPCTGGRGACVLDFFPPLYPCLIMYLALNGRLIPFSSVKLMCRVKHTRVCFWARVQGGIQSVNI